jgi:AbrB family looped-hinge helix DNA binding protein
MTPMTRKNKVSTQGRTVIPAEIREKLGIRDGEELEWVLEGEVIVVKPLREVKTPDEIMEYLRNHLVDIRSVPGKMVPIDLKKQMMDKWARRKLGLTP